MLLANSQTQFFAFMENQKVGGKTPFKNSEAKQIFNNILNTKLNDKKQNFLDINNLDQSQSLESNLDEIIAFLSGEKDISSTLPPKLQDFLSKNQKKITKYLNSKKEDNSKDIGILENLNTEDSNISKEEILNNINELFANFLTNNFKQEENFDETNFNLSSDETKSAKKTFLNLDKIKDSVGNFQELSQVKENSNSSNKKNTITTEEDSIDFNLPKIRKSKNFFVKSTASSSVISNEKEENDIIQKDKLNLNKSIKDISKEDKLDIDEKSLDRQLEIETKPKKTTNQENKNIKNTEDILAQKDKLLFNASIENPVKEAKSENDMENFVEDIVLKDNVKKPLNLADLKNNRQIHLKENKIDTSGEISLKNVASENNAKNLLNEAALESNLEQSLNLNEDAKISANLNRENFSNKESKKIRSQRNEKITSTNNKDIDTNKNQTDNKDLKIEFKSEQKQEKTDTIKTKDESESLNISKNSKKNINNKKEVENLNTQTTADLAKSNKDKQYILNQQDIIAKNTFENMTTKNPSNTKPAEQYGNFDIKLNVKNKKKVNKNNLQKKEDTNFNFSKMSQNEEEKTNIIQSLNKEEINPNNDNKKNIFKKDNKNNKLDENSNFNVESKTSSLTQAAENMSETARPQPKILPSYVLKQVKGQLVQAMRNGDSQVVIRLDPPSLGKLQVSIDASTSGIKISVLAEKHATNEIISSNANELKTALEKQGINLDKIEVKTAFNFDQSASNQNQQQANFVNKKKNTKIIFDKESEDNKDGNIKINNTLNTSRINNDGTMSFFA